MVAPSPRRQRASLGLELSYVTMTNRLRWIQRLIGAIAAVAVAAPCCFAQVRGMPRTGASESRPSPIRPGTHATAVLGGAASPARTRAGPSNFPLLPAGSTRPPAVAGRSNPVRSSAATSLGSTRPAAAATRSNPVRSSAIASLPGNKAHAPTPHSARTAPN